MAPCPRAQALACDRSAISTAFTLPACMQLCVRVALQSGPIIRPPPLFLATAGASRRAYTDSDELICVVACCRHGLASGSDCTVPLARALEQAVRELQLSRVLPATYKVCAREAGRVAALASVLPVSSKAHSRWRACSCFACPASAFFDVCAMRSPALQCVQWRSWARQWHWRVDEMAVHVCLCFAYSDVSRFCEADPTPR